MGVANDYLTGENKKKTAQIAALNAEIAALKQVCERLHYEKGVTTHQRDAIYARITDADRALGIERFAALGLETTNRKLLADNIVLKGMVEDMTKMLRESEKGTTPATPAPVFVRMTPSVIAPTPDVVVVIAPTPDVLVVIAPTPPPVPAPVAVIIEVEPVDPVEQAELDAAATERFEKYKRDAAEAKKIKNRLAEKIRRDRDFAAKKEIREAKALADEQERLKTELAAKALADEKERQEKAKVIAGNELVIPEKGTAEYKAFILAQLSCRREMLLCSKSIAELDTMVVVEPSMKNARLFRDTLRDVFLNTNDDKRQDNIDTTPEHERTTIERVLLSAQELFSIGIWNILPVKDSSLYELHCVMPELRSFEVVKSPPARLEFIAECLDSRELLDAVTKLRSFIPLSCKKNHAIKYERLIEFCSTYLTWVMSCEEGLHLASILKLTKIDELDTFLSRKYSLVHHLDTGEEQVMKISITRLVEWHRRGKLNIIADHSLKVSATSATATKIPGIE